MPFYFHIFFTLLQFRGLKELQCHLESIHNYSFVSKVMEFDDIEQFQRWRNDFEDTQMVNFVIYGKRPLSKAVVAGCTDRPMPGPSGQP